MWPRLIGRGELTMKVAQEKYPRGFNVATAHRPWRTPAVLIHLPAQHNASMWPRLIGRGERLQARRLFVRSRKGFNVATAHRPWRTRHTTQPNKLRSKRFNVA